MQNRIIAVQVPHFFYAESPEEYISAFFKEEFAARKKPVEDDMTANLNRFYHSLGRKPGFHQWAELSLTLMRHTMSFMTMDELLKMSRVQKFYQQHAKAVLLKRFYPEDYEQLLKQGAADFSLEFKKIHRCEKKDVDEKSKQKLLILFKEGDLKQIKAEKNFDIRCLFLIKQNGSLLQWAARKGHQHILDYFYGVFLKEIYSLTIYDDCYFGYRAPFLTWASIFNQEHVVAKLLTFKRINIEKRGGNDATALWEATWHGHKNIVRMLVEHKADVNAAHRCLGTPLIASYRNANIAEYLLDHGAQIDAQDSDGNTALITALCMNVISTAMLLLNRGANPTLKNKRKQSALDFACDIDMKKIIFDAEINWILTHEKLPDAEKERLIWLRESVASSDLHSWQAILNFFLWKAAQLGYENIVIFLLDKHAQIDAQIPHVRCPALHIAAKYGQRDVVQCLIRRGASVTKLYQGFTAFDYASDDAIKKFLLLTEIEMRLDLMTIVSDQGREKLGFFNGIQIPLRKLYDALKADDWQGIKQLQPQFSSGKLAEIYQRANSISPLPQRFSVGEGPGVRV